MNSLCLEKDLTLIYTDHRLLADYAPEARVIVPGDTGAQEIPVSELLRLRYRKDGRPL